jgi:predicted acylesterase/phospholipase RssA
MPDQHTAATSHASRLGIVLSGYAPAMTLMSGAMLGFAQKQVAFDIISTSGVGGLIGLLALAPKAKPTPAEALAELPNLFMSDLLYAFFPVNVKLFFKYGPFSEPFWKFRQQLPKLPVAPEDASPFRRLMNDWVDLAMSALTPTTYDFFSKGLMTEVPLIDTWVDFDRLKQASTTFYLNAFNLSNCQLHIFDNHSMNADTYHAAQSMFFLFRPQRIRSQVFSLGTTHDPTGLQALWTRHKHDLDMIIALDTVSASIWREPVDIYDAFQLMLVNPIVALEELLFAMYAQTEYLVNTYKPGKRLPKLYRVPFDAIPKAYYPEMLKWTHSNAVTLQRIGHDAATTFADVLQSGDAQALEAYRYHHYVAGNLRLECFLRIFPRLFATPGTA